MSEQYHNIHKYSLHFCDSHVEDLTFPASFSGFIESSHLGTSINNINMQYTDEPVYQ